MTINARLLFSFVLSVNTYYTKIRYVNWHWDSTLGNRQKIFGCISTFLLTFAANGTAWAATYYVSTSGSDSNPGTQAAPFRTIAHAVDKMVAGDTTYVKGGVYREGNIRFGRSGTESAPIKLLNAPGEFPIIDFIGPVVRLIMRMVIILRGLKDSICGFLFTTILVQRTPLAGSH